MMLTGNNGILQQATTAKTETIHKNVLEQMQLEANAYTIDKTTGNTALSLIDFLKGKSIITEIADEEGKWQINVEKLLGEKQTMGNGTATVDKKEDVYILEEQITPTGSNENVKVATTMPVKIAATTSNSKIYNVVYYGIDVTAAIELGNVCDDIISKEDEGNNIITFQISIIGENEPVSFSVKKGTTWFEWANDMKAYTGNDWKINDLRTLIGNLKTNTDISGISGTGKHTAKYRLENELRDNIIQANYIYTLSYRVEVY